MPVRNLVRLVAHRECALALFFADLQRAVDGEELVDELLVEGALVRRQ